MQSVGRQCVEGAVVRSCQSLGIERPKLEEPATPEAPDSKGGSCTSAAVTTLLKSSSLVVRVVYHVRKTMIMMMMMMMMMMSHGP